jgi:hypothetical protein
VQPAAYLNDLDENGRFRTPGFFRIAVRVRGVLEDVLRADVDLCYYDKEDLGTFRDHRNTEVLLACPQHEFAPREATWSGEWPVKPSHVVLKWRVPFSAVHDFSLFSLIFQIRMALGQTTEQFSE